MATDRYIAALEISSSKVIGAVGAVGKSGQLEILAVEQNKCIDIVRYGQIQNIEMTSQMIDYVLERLERRHNVEPREITGVYVGLSGRSVRNIEKEVSMTLPDDTEITDSILRSLKQKALDSAIDSSLEIIDAVPRIFTVDHQETHQPRGRMGNHISAIYDLIVARPVIRNFVRNVVREKLGLDIKGFILTQLALGDMVLNEQEKKLGCMLVDLGAETTSVTIYTQGNLVYYATIPMGGRNITLDLKELNLIEDKAEEYKISFGNAIAPSSPSQETIGTVKLSSISNYVVARAEEIVTNIGEQVRYAGLTEKDIPDGIVLCGGGARLNGLADLIGKFTGLKVRMASCPPSVIISDHNGQSVESLQVAAIMHAASKMTDDGDCLQVPAPPEPEPQPEPTPQPEPEHKGKGHKDGKEGKDGRKKGRGFGSFIKKWLTPIDDDDEGDELYS